MIDTTIQPKLNETNLPLPTQAETPQPSRFSFLQGEDEKMFTTLSQLSKWHILPRILPKLFDENIDYYKQIGYSQSTALIANIFLRSVMQMDKEPKDRQSLLEIVNRSIKATLFSNYMLTVSQEVFSHTGTFVTFSATALGAESSLAYYPLALVTGAPTLIAVGLTAQILSQIVSSTGLFNAVFDSIDFMTQTILPSELEVQPRPPEIEELTVKLALIDPASIQ